MNLDRFLLRMNATVFALFVVMILLNFGGDVVYYAFGNVMEYLLITVFDTAVSGVAAVMAATPETLWPPYFSKYVLIWMG